MRYIYLGIIIFLLGGCAHTDKTAESVQETSAKTETLQTQTEAPEAPKAPEELSAANYPKVDGSTATLPLSQALYARITGADMEEAAQVIHHTKTTSSYMSLIDKKADILIVAEGNEAVDAYASQQGVELLYTPIARDAFVFIANEENPVESLTLEQVVDIYRGKIKNWSDLGGEDQPIIPFQRNENAGSQTLMKELVMKDVPLMNAPMLVLESMSTTLEEVASYSNTANALGYSVFYYAALMKQTPGLRFMAVNGVSPSYETIGQGTYPLITSYYAVIRADEPEDSPARALLSYLEGAEGQELVQEMGYVPVTAQELPEGVQGHPEARDSRLSIGEDELLLLHIDECSSILLDAQLRILAKLDNMVWRNPAVSYLYDQTAILNKEPQIFYTDHTLAGTSPEKVKENFDMRDGNMYLDWTAGLLEPLTGKWILDPIYQDIFKMAEGVYGTVNDLEDGTPVITLVDREGNELFREEGCGLVPLGEDGTPGCILKSDGLYGLDGKLKVKDQDALLVDQVTAAWYRVNTDWEYETHGGYVYKDWTGQALSLLADRLIFETYGNGYQLWSGQGMEMTEILTDAKGKVVLDLQIFADSNPLQEMTKDYFGIHDYDEETEQYLIEFMPNAFQSVYAVCNKEFQIEKIYEDYPEEMKYAQTGDTLVIEEFWRGETIIPKLPTDRNITWVQKLDEGVYYLHYEGDTSFYYRKGDLVSIPSEAVSYAFLTEYGVTLQGIQTVDDIQPPNLGFYNFRHGFFMLPKVDESIVYYDNEVYCRKSDGYLTFMNYEGELLLRVPLE
jgi:ABC-type phosphate transport system substrate-binding protein